MKRTILTFCILSVLGASVASADNQNRDTRKNDDRSGQRASLANPDSKETATLEKAAEAYRKVIHTSRGDIPASVINSAKCIAIVPNVITAAAAIGGMHGDGVGFCKSSTGQWSGPAFLSLNAASIGAQAGVKATDMVFFISRDDAQKAMLEDGFTFGGELSAVVGTYDKSFAMPRSGVVVFSDTEGVFAGASISEGRLSRNDTRGKEYYGDSYDKTNLFSTNNPLRDSAPVKNVLALLPK